MSQNKKKFLFAFADDGLAKTLTELLKRNEPEIVVVPSGQEALFVSRKMNPHLIVLDANLPDMTGVQICQQLKSEPAFKTIPIVIAAPQDDRTLIDNCYRGHYDDVLPKPFNKDEVTTRIYEALKENGRKLNRASLKSMVDIEADSGTISAEGRNINTKFFLVSALTKLNLNENYLLTFDLKGASDPIHVWGRLEKISDPRERKVTDKDYLLLFRFLNLDLDSEKRIADFTGTQITPTTQNKKKTSTRTILLLISLVLVLVGINAKHFFPADQRENVRQVALTLQTPIPFLSSKSTDSVVVLYLAPTWDTLDEATKKEMAEKALVELNLKGFEKMLLVGGDGSVKGTGSQDGGVTLTQ